MSLKLEHNGKQIPIADIEIKSSNEQVTLGNTERNLILKTLGKISVQVGNKYFDLDFSTDKQGDNFINNIYTIKDGDGLNVNQYPNGSFVYSFSNNGLYFIYNKKIIELSAGSKSKIFLSFAEEQELNGEEARRLVFNAKLRIEKLEDVLYLTSDDVYEKQIIFVEDQKQHYLLENYNYPNVLTNWVPLYLSTNGGTLLDGLTIYNKTKNFTLNLEGLHKEGSNIYRGLKIGTDNNYIRTAALENGYIKTETNSKGLILNRNNNTIFEYDQGKIGIGGKASRSDIDNMIYGKTKLTGNLFTNYNIMSDDYMSRNVTLWNGGKGYALKKTSIGTWFLEIDDLVVRNSLSAEVLNLKELAVDRTYATGGHMMVTDGAVITFIEYKEKLKEEDKIDVTHPLKETELNGFLEIGESYYFIYFSTKDEIPNEETGESPYDAGAFCPFIKGDMLLCQNFKGLKTKKYYLTVSYSDNYRIAVKYNDLYNSYIIEDSERPSTDYTTENSISIKDELVRIGNQDPKRISRQKIIDINGLKNWITMYDNLDSFVYAKDEEGNPVYDELGNKIVIDGPLNYSNLKLRIGDLAGLPDLGKGGTAVLPEDTGYGLYADNVYLKGKIVLWRNEDGIDYTESLGINRGKWSPTEKYYLGDRVTHDGSYYYCNKVNETGFIINLSPNDYIEYWTLLVAKGANGLPGDSVNYINITGISYFKIDSLGNSDPPAISLTANLHNVDVDPTLKTIRYQWICNSTVIKDITYSESFENHLTDNLNILYKGKNTNVVDVEIKETDWTPIWKDANYNTFICNIFINGTNASEDQFTIYKIQDGNKGDNGIPGESALTFILSNEAITIPSSYNGYISPDFIGLNSKSEVNLKVFRGKTELTYNETPGKDTFNFIIESEASSFFQKTNNKFFLIKGNYIDTSSPVLPNGFIVNLKITIDGILYNKKVSFSLSKAGQDSNLLDWIKEWTGNSTEISSDGIISPKLYIGNKISKVDGKYIITDGIYLGRGLNENDPSSFIGYKNSSRMFELTTDGRFFLGKQITGATASTIPIYSKGGLSFDGEKLIIGNDASIGTENKTLGDYITVINSYGPQIDKIVGDKYITVSELFNLKEIVTRIAQEYKDIETSLAGLLGVSDIATLPSLSNTFKLYNDAYNQFKSVLNYYINATPDSSGFIPIIADKNLVTSNTTYYSTLTSVKLDIENLRKNKFDTNTANVFRQENQPTVRPGNSPLQVGDIWIKINSSNQDLFSEIVISVVNGVATWKFLGDNTGTVIDEGLISTGTIRLMAKNSTADKAGITGSNAIGLYFNPLDLSQTSSTSNTIHSEVSYIRFWGGLKDSNKNWNDAPFRVYENGALFASAGKIGCLSINGENFNVGGTSQYSNINTGNKENSLLRIKPGLTISENGDIIGQDFYLSGDSTKRSSIFVGKVYFINNGNLESAEDKINRINSSLNEMFSLVFINNTTGEILEDRPSVPDNYTIAIKANFGLFTNSFLSAKGASPGSGGGGGASSLSQLIDVNINNPTNRQALVYDSTTSKWINGSAGLTDFTVKVGGSSYNSVNGIVSLPAYPPTTDLSNYVTLNTTQTITGTKTIINLESLNWNKNTDMVDIYFKNDSDSDTDSYLKFISGDNGNEGFSFFTKAASVEHRIFDIFNGRVQSYSNITAPSFVKANGIASQLLRADGGVATFNWAGHNSTPTWVWGAENQYDYNLYAPRYFRVANADTVGDIAASNLVTKQNWTSVVDGRYLPLSGGILTGSTELRGGTFKAGQYSNGTAIVDAYSSYAFFGNDESENGIRISNTGELQNSATGSRFWHADNDGSGSGLDADLLDGNHYNSILERKATTFFGQVQSDAWYRVGEFIGNNAESIQAIIMINRSYNSPQNEGYAFSITVGYNGNFNVSQLSGDVAGHIIDKIRFDYTNSGKVYLDVHCNYTGYTNQLYITSIGSFTSYTTPIVNPGTNSTLSGEFLTRNGIYNNNIISTDIGFKSRNICIETDNYGNEGGRSSEINNFNSILYLNNASATNVLIATGGGNVGIKTHNPFISLAIGDSDTGFNWAQDGMVKGMANGVDIFYWNTTEFYSFKSLYGDGIFPCNNNTGNCGAADRRWGNAYVNDWYYSRNAGFYIDAGSLYFGNNSGYIELGSAGSELIITGGNEMNVNYRGSAFSKVMPVHWKWRAGSSSSWASMEMADITIHGNASINNRVTAGEFMTSGWYRTVGQAGWYNETYNSGIYMEDSTYVRTYNGKSFMSTCVNVFHAFNSQGGYYSTWNTSRPDSWYNALEQSHSVFNLPLMYVDNHTYQNIIGWHSVINNIGYQTRYSIGSKRANSWGGLALSVGNSDAGDNGHQLVLWGDGRMTWTSTFYSTVGIYSDGYVSAKGQNTSDIRLKTNIQDFNATNLIKQLQPKSYNWNDDAKAFNPMFEQCTQYGLIAQWSNGIIDGLVVENMFDDGYYGIRYDKLIPIMLKAQLENINRLETIEDKVERLERENEVKTKKNEELERRAYDKQ